MSYEFCYVRFCSHFCLMTFYKTYTKKKKKKKSCVHELLLLYLPLLLAGQKSIRQLWRDYAKFSTEASVLINAPTARHHPALCYRQMPKKVEGNTLEWKTLPPSIPDTPSWHLGPNSALLVLRGVATMDGWMEDGEFAAVRHKLLQDWGKIRRF